MYRKLSETEMLILKEMWKIGKPICVKELADWFSVNKKIEWKVQTIATFLTRMERKNFVKGRKTGKVMIYEPTITEEEMQSIEAKGLLENHFGGSFKQFLVAFSAGSISNEQAEELEKWLNEQKEGKN